MPAIAIKRANASSFAGSPSPPAISIDRSDNPFSILDVRQKLLVPSHQRRAVSGARVSQELRRGFLAVGESRGLLLEMDSPAHLVVQIGVAVQSNPEPENDPVGA